MVTKKQSTVEKKQKKAGVKVGKLRLQKETIKDLPVSEAKRVKGGLTASCLQCRAGGGNSAQCGTGTVIRVTQGGSAINCC